MYNICQNTVILVIFILCWRERDLPNIIKLKAKERRIPERRIHQNIVGIFLWYNMSQGVQNSISVPLDRCGFGGQNIMPTLENCGRFEPAIFSSILQKVKWRLGRVSQIFLVCLVFFFLHTLLLVPEIAFYHLQAAFHQSIVVVFTCLHQVSYQNRQVSRSGREGSDRWKSLSYQILF